MISGLSDDNISFLIEIIRRLMPQSGKNGGDAVSTVHDDAGMQAFRRLDAARAESREYLPEEFDPERELEKAKEERYGGIG